MTKLIMHEIDGTDTIINAEPADGYYAMLGDETKDACLAKGLHLYKDDADTCYLAGEDKVVLAKGMTTIRTYITYLL